uniref:Zinc metalloproteinase n=1 Tax=Strongyloides stercoralis TaxID=6248 RepID=A0A0K0E2V5_STRER
MKFNNCFLLLFINIINILSLNFTENNYTNDNLNFFPPCYICSIINGYLSNFTYEVLGTFSNLSTTNVTTSTVVMPVTSVTELSSSFITLTNILSTTSNNENILTTSFIPTTSISTDTTNITTLISIPITTNKLVNPFLIKLNRTTSEMFITSSPITTISNSTISSLLTTTEKTIEEIIEAPIFSFKEISILLSNVEANITNIISNINLTDIQNINTFITSFNTQIQNIFIDILSILKNNTMLKNTTFS